MTKNGEKFSALIPGHPARSVVQFYVEGIDNTGAISWFPPEGPDSRALFKVDDGRARLGEVHQFPDRDVE